MKQIVNAYGKMFLVAIVTVAVFALILWNVEDDQGNKGIFAIIGAQLPAGEERSGDEYDVYSVEAAKDAPTIMFWLPEKFSVGTYELNTFIGAYDCDGNTIDYVLSGVTSPNGTEWTETESMTEINFMTAGVYEIEVTATDSNNRTSIRKILVPVNESVIKPDIL